LNLEGKMEKINKIDGFEIKIGILWNEFYIKPYKGVNYLSWLFIHIWYNIYTDESKVDDNLDKKLENLEKFIRNKTPIVQDLLKKYAIEGGRIFLFFDKEYSDVYIEYILREFKEIGRKFRADVEYCNVVFSELYDAVDFKKGEMK
jgi:hypothetical protein